MWASEGAAEVLVGCLPLEGPLQQSQDLPGTKAPDLGDHYCRVTDLALFGCITHQKFLMNSCARSQHSMPVELHCIVSTHSPVQEPAYRDQDLIHGLTCRPQLLDMADGTQQCDLAKEQVILVVCSTQVQIICSYFSSISQPTADDQQFERHILHEQFDRWNSCPRLSIRPFHCSY